MGAITAKLKRTHPEKPKTDDDYKALLGDDYGIVKTIASGPSYKVKFAFKMDEKDPVVVKIMKDITAEQMEHLTNDITILK